MSIAGTALGLAIALPPRCFEVEITLGTVASIIGVPFFLMLLKRSQRGWS